MCTKYSLISCYFADINLGPWSEEVDEGGEKHRTNSFTVAINASFGPKSTSSVEQQVRMTLTSYPMI